MFVRLQKHIADLGYCSRRKAEVLIAEGKVKINGTIVRTLGTKVDPKTDMVEIIGAERPRAVSQSSGISSRELKTENHDLYIILNKPIDYISNSTSAQGESIMDILTPEKYTGKRPGHVKSMLGIRVYPVGRLDKDSEGLVLLTNDGALAQLLTHPKYEHTKEYEVTIDGRLDKKSQHILENGMKIDKDEVANGIDITDISNRGKRTVVTISLKEEKNGHIRKMFSALGFQVISLKRTRIGNLHLGTIPVGTWKEVTKKMIIS